MNTYLFLRQIIRKVGNHDLVLGWDTIRRWATLTTGFTGFASSLGGLGVLVLSSARNVGGVGQGKNFTSGRKFRTFLTSGLREC
jgi:hypothetical protein